MVTDKELPDLMGRFPAAHCAQLRKSLRSHMLAGESCRSRPNPGGSGSAAACLCGLNRNPAPTLQNPLPCQVLGPPPWHSGLES